MVVSLVPSEDECYALDEGGVYDLHIEVVNVVCPFGYDETVLLRFVIEGLYDWFELLWFGENGMF